MKSAIWEVQYRLQIHRIILKNSLEGRCMASLRTFMKKQIGQIISICPEKKDFPVREDVMFDYYAATNYGITELVYGSVPESGDRNENIEYGRC